MSKVTKQIKTVAKKKIKKKKKPSEFLSSGSTLYNLACTNSPYGAFPKGKYIYFVGDSTSGKTFISMTCFAEALHSPIFKDYRLIYDNVEDGMLINLEKLFNKKVAKRVEAPVYDGDIPVYSSTIEEFYYNLDDVIKEGKSFIYVLDSMDGLSSESEQDKFKQHKKAHREKKEAPGSYGDGKAKKNSENIRKVLKGIRDTGSILIIISQTRDNLGFGSNKKIRSGGKALKFYATIEAWSSPTGKIKKSIKGKDRTIGIHVEMNIKKNRITGEEHKIPIDIYPSYGIDDIGACIDFLISEKWWSKKKKTIEAAEFDFVGKRSSLIERIEDGGLYKKLQKITGECWQEIQEEKKLKRKKKYEEDDE